MRMNLRRKLAWVALWYFAEGFPYGLVKDVFPVYFRLHGVSLTAIGWMSLLGLPWTWKVLWSPLVDRYCTLKQWIAAALCTMAILLCVLPTLDAAYPSVALWVVLLSFCIASATQDIAIDALTIGVLEPGEEGAANGVRVAAYRGGLIVAGGALLFLPRWVGWAPVFPAAALVCVLLAATMSRAPARRVADAKRDWLASTWRWLGRPSAIPVVAFVLTYKLGDASMAPMIKPFWVDRGFQPEEIGLVSTTFGVVATVVGALAGGALTSRYGLFRGLWTLGLVQALSNLGYAAAAHSNGDRLAVYSAGLVESFTGGLGTAAFLAFLMHICEKEHAAVQYAFLSAVFALSRDVVGGVSGWATTRLGYDNYFLLTFFLALPAYAFLPYVRRWIRDDRE